ncbi:torsin-1A-interacting protein 2-like [Rhinophrynus dorsalis]
MDTSAPIQQTEPISGQGSFSTINQPQYSRSHQRTHSDPIQASLPKDEVDKHQRSEETQTDAGDSQPLVTKCHSAETGSQHFKESSEDILAEYDDGESAKNQSDAKPEATHTEKSVDKPVNENIVSFQKSQAKKEENNENLETGNEPPEQPDTGGCKDRGNFDLEKSPDSPKPCADVSSEESYHNEARKPITEENPPSQPAEKKPSTESGTQPEERREPPRSDNLWSWKVVVPAALISILMYYYQRWPAPSSDVSNSSVLKTFQKEFEHLETFFPGQNEALWLRSQKILLKHLNKSQPLEPVIFILTAANNGERTLRCFSEGLARVYSNSLNASWVVIDGPSKSKYDSNTTKLEIDKDLTSGFESKARAAVLHRLEELPPGSLLILYKYCDHENAAFKNVALVLTVLLDDPELEPDLSLVELEEKVKDFLWETFTSPNSISAHHEMNGDKLGGVWSRISHLVLPVLPVENIETGSCPWNKNEPYSMV